MEVKVKLPSFKAYEQIDINAKRLTIPFLVRNAGSLQAAVKRRWKSGRGTDGEKEFNLPPYSDTRKEIRKDRGLSTRPDYVQSGQLINSLSPSVLPDKKTGGVKLIDSPKGKHISKKQAKAEQRARKGRRMSSGKWQRDPQTTKVLTAGDRYLRKAYSYRRHSTGTTVQVPSHFVKLPPEDVEGKTARTSRSGWWFWVWYQHDQTLRTKKIRKVSLYNRDLAYYLSRRLGRGRWSKGKVRLHPFIQFGPQERKGLAYRYAKQVLPSLAKTLNI